MFVGIHSVDYIHFSKIARKPEFRSKILTSHEMKSLMLKSFPTRYIAMMYCAKIAFIKAMGGSASGCRMNEISVLFDYNESPYISLLGRTKIRFEARKCKISVSASYNKYTAEAIVLLYPVVK
ncbi:MAG: 4'-phosphopantetheinyl transferase superfamily protein [Ruminococcus sp.]|nr:4'-phosphopantetheinyl transferase superfamily protein [Ruminococcus sp.]